MVLSEGGAPLSAGQKQLVAMARALLRHSKVLATLAVLANTQAWLDCTRFTEYSALATLPPSTRGHALLDFLKSLSLSICDHSLHNCYTGFWLLYAKQEIHMCTDSQMAAPSLHTGKHKIFPLIVSNRQCIERH